MGIWQRVVVSSVLAVVAMLPVAGLCCMLACAAPAHRAAGTPSHCVDMPGEAATAVSAVVICETVTETLPADPVRPLQPGGPDAGPLTVAALLPPAAHAGPAAATELRRLPPRASPLPFVLRI